VSFDPYAAPGSARLDQKSRRLADELAGHLRVAKDRHIVWTEIELPDGGRADVFAIRPSWSKRDLRVYEVKTSRSDFLRDVNADKWRRYLPFCNRLYFACPSGLVKRAEVPDPAGLVTRNENGWRVVKPPIPREIETPTFDWMVSLLDRTFFTDTLATRRLRQRLVWEDNAVVGALAHQYGGDVARKLRVADDPDRVEAASLEHQAALRLCEQIRLLAVAAGVSPRYGGFGEPEKLSLDDLSHFAEEAVRLIENADLLDRLAAALRSLTYRHDRVRPDAEATLARIESP